MDWDIGFGHNNWQKKFVKVQLSYFGVFITIFDNTFLLKELT